MSLSTCGKCHGAVSLDDRVYKHGLDHQFHLQCIKQHVVATILSPKCPCCPANLNVEDILSGKDKVSMIFNWVKRGALIGGIGVLAAGVLLGPPMGVREALFLSTKGMIYGGIASGLLKIKTMAISSILTPYFPQKTFPCERSITQL